LSLKHPKVIDHRKHSFENRLSHFKTSVREVELAAQINLGLIRFLWNFQTAQRNRRQGPHFTPLKLWALLKERWDLRISDWKWNNTCASKGNLDTHTRHITKQGWQKVHYL
jgi:hypothetical protein